jgi:hypothetical protein
MKRFAGLMIGFLVFQTKILCAQTAQPGIYLTYKDYLEHRLSYAGKADDITFHEFFGESFISVSSGGKKFHLAKNEVYGYRDKNEDYRFFNNRSYRILDTIGFYLYSRDKIAASGKKIVQTKFFSTSGNTAIFPLTLSHVNAAFAQSHHFKYMVDAQFKSDAELIEFDTIEKKYKIKEIYLDAVKE